MKIVKVYKILSAFLFYLTLIVIISGINFSGNRSPGWFLQPLPINDNVTDIFFTDTLHGWVVTYGQPNSNDTGYIFHTTNGGYDWTIQKREAQAFRVVQFLDTNYGYVVGGYQNANIQKTTNGGNNWIDISSNFANTIWVNDLSFVNNDTGWVCVNDIFGGGIYRTINGGLNWIFQKSDNNAYKLFFISKDTGWYCTNASSGKLWRTTNGGSNWNLQYTTSYPFDALFFLNNSKGWITAGYLMYTTDGGFTWTNAQNTIGGENIKFINENTGYAGIFAPPPRIAKSTDGGKIWGYQVMPYSSNNLIAILKNDNNNAWAGNFMHTTDGGGAIIYTGIKPNNNFIPSFELRQNYPNPFNPSTKIRFIIYKSSYIDLIIYDISGREITQLISNKLYINSGSYEVNFNPQKQNLSSGVYIYTMKAETENHKEIFIDSKKMLMIK